MVRNLKLRNFEVFWESPASKRWRSALSIDDAKGVEIENFSGTPAVLGSDVPAIAFTKVEGALIRNSTVREGTKTLLGLSGPLISNIVLQGNDLRRAARSYTSSPDVPKNAVILLNNLSTGR